MTIRPAAQVDQARILQLLGACGLPTSDLTPASFAHFLICEVDDAIAGTAAVEPCGPDALLRSVAVREDMRGQGIADRLVQAAESAARTSGFRALYLLTTTAAPYFVRRGWQEIERAAAPEAIGASAEFTELCPSSSVCMRKWLD